MKNDNQELIKSCRETISGEDEPESMEWLDMVEALCDALEKTDNELITLKSAIIYLHDVLQTGTFTSWIQKV